MLIILTRQQVETIIAHSIKSLPIEACGLLGGKIEGEKRMVSKVYPMNNVDQSPEHFSMDPKEQFAVIKDMRANNWVMLGNFHSHPESPSRPSEEDKRLAYDAEASYLILSLLDNEHPVLKSFRIQGGEVKEDPIMVEEE